jgi:hypothetical protein
MKIFGREPALIIAFVSAVLMWAVSLGLDWLNAGQATAAVAVVAAIVMAITTRPIGPGVFVAGLSAVAALFAEYGLHWSDASVTGLGAIIMAGFALNGIRPQATPAADPRPLP